MKEKICPVCGKAFRPMTNQKYCSVNCRQDARYARLGKTREKKVRPPKKIKNAAVHEVARIARAVGMSYGQYVALYAAPKIRRKSQ